MKVAVFSTKSYDKEYLDKANTNNKHELTYFEASLKEKSAKLAEGQDAVCVFVNDRLTLEVIQNLAEMDVKLIALRCAGFNNVDIESAHHAHRAEFARTDPLKHTAIVRAGVDLRADLANAFVAVHRVANGEALTHMQRHRLLQIDVFASLGGRDGLEGVPMRRRGNDNRIQLLLLQHLPVV